MPCSKKNLCRDVIIFEFTSKKITTKILQQIEEPLALASGALPDWCERLTSKCPFLIPFETRQLFFTCTAFGRSRASTTVRRDDPGDFRVGRLKHERVKVPRGDAMMEWAETVMQIHSDRKSVLEVSAQEGTGLGPTLEFYALVAAEFQTTALGIWLCDDDFPDDESRQVAILLSRTHSSFFPLSLTRASSGTSIDALSGAFGVTRKASHRISKLFRFLGVFLAKCIQDNRLVDLPISRPFFKLLCMGDIKSNMSKLLYSPQGGGADPELCLSVSSFMICRCCGALPSEGFNGVFPMEKLSSFSHKEVQLILCGNQSPSWTSDDIINYTEPKLGYTRDRSRPFCLSSSPRSCRSLLVGTFLCGFCRLQCGLPALCARPLRDVVGREENSSYPSVNTCVHYLKLPEYSSEDIMRERLLAATMEKGFHLN
uniref:E3 ubiquitin-protein ligase n=1 Tax=Hippocampus comes TaxID=109280 RepID=A0A3Q2X7C6_HIPCM